MLNSPFFYLFSETDHFWLLFLFHFGCSIFGNVLPSLRFLAFIPFRKAWYDVAFVSFVNELICVLVTVNIYISNDNNLVSILWSYFLGHVWIVFLSTFSLLLRWYPIGFHVIASWLSLSFRSRSRFRQRNCFSPFLLSLQSYTHSVAHMKFASVAACLINVSIIFLSARLLLFSSCPIWMTFFIASNWCFRIGVEQCLYSLNLTIISVAITHIAFYTNTNAYICFHCQGNFAQWTCLLHIRHFTVSFGIHNFITDIFHNRLCVFTENVSIFFSTSSSSFVAIAKCIVYKYATNLDIYSENDRFASKFFQQYIVCACFDWHRYAKPQHSSNVNICAVLIFPFIQSTFHDCWFVFSLRCNCKTSINRSHFIHQQNPSVVFFPFFFALFQRYFFMAQNFTSTSAKTKI